MTNNTKETKPDHIKNNEAKTAKILAQQISFSGPLPPPSILREYNEMIEGGGERIMKMAEQHLDHRISLESKALSAELKQNSRGQICGFILGIAGIVGTIFLAVTGHDTVACALVGTTIGSLAVAFVVGKKIQIENQTKKRP